MNHFPDQTAPRDHLEPCTGLLPEPARMRDVLLHLQAQLDLGKVVHVDCWGGIGLSPQTPAQLAVVRSRAPVSFLSG